MLQKPVLLLCFLMWLLPIGCGPQVLTITVPSSSLQKLFDSLFPYEEKVGGTQLELSDPKVILTNGSDRIGLQLTLQTEGPRSSRSDQVLVEGKVRYDAKQAAFFLLEPTVARQGKPENVRRERVHKALESALGRILVKKPIYQLDQEDTVQKLAGSHLVDISVKDGKVVARLGW
ncbi:MAG: DUF1439 domain-containing protein [Planctomycetales bacterium]